MDKQIAVQHALAVYDSENNYWEFTGDTCPATPSDLANLEKLQLRYPRSSIVTTYKNVPSDISSFHCERINGVWHTWMNYKGAELAKLAHSCEEDAIAANESNQSTISTLGV